MHETRQVNDKQLNQKQTNFDLVTARDECLQQPHPLTDPLPPHLEKDKWHHDQEDIRRKIVYMCGAFDVPCIPSLRGCGYLLPALSLPSHGCIPWVPPPGPAHCCSSPSSLSYSCHPCSPSNCQKLMKQSF